MRVEIHPSWEKVLQPLFETTSFENLAQFLKKEYAENVCYPPGRLIFDAFNACPLEQLKVVIIGQDPYHGPGQAHGLSFSVLEGVSPPSSLVNIFREIENDLGIPFPKVGNLSPGANQGVFLLNATLSVRAHQAGEPPETRLGSFYRPGDSNHFNAKEGWCLCYGEAMPKRKPNS